jgi:DNA-binding beta-propeller fold protein YncE
VPTTGLSDPLGLALDGRGGLYVADGFNNRVVRVAESGGGQVTLPASGLSTPTGVAFPPADKPVG